MNDPVNHPKHYTAHPSGIEYIQITRHMGFNLGNAFKYIWRCDLKGGVEDLKKAVWYLQDEINKLEGQTQNQKINFDLSSNSTTKEQINQIAKELQENHPQDEFVEINGFKFPRKEIKITLPEETQEMARTPKPLPIDEDAPAEFATPIIPQHLLEEATRGLDKSKSVPSTETKQPRKLVEGLPIGKRTRVPNAPKPKGHSGSIRASRKPKSRG